MAILISAGAFASPIVQFIAKNGIAPYYSGATFAINPLGTWTNLLTSSSGDIGSMSNGAWYDDGVSAQTELKMKVVALGGSGLRISSTGLGVLGGAGNYVDPGESLEFEFDSDVNLFQVYLNTGNGKSYILDYNGTTVTNANLNTFNFPAGEVLLAGSKLKIIGYDDGVDLSKFMVGGITVQAIPEPAALGMIAFGAGAILFVRRRLML